MENLRVEAKAKVVIAEGEHNHNHHSFLLFPVYNDLGLIPFFN
jgi:hypothetical protein